MAQPSLIMSLPRLTWRRMGACFIQEMAGRVERRLGLSFRGRGPLPTGQLKQDRSYALPTISGNLAKRHLCSDPRVAEFKQFPTPRCDDRLDTATKRPR
eukprot:6931690-Pyramimonas_sp.AAC.1